MQVNVTVTGMDKAIKELASLNGDAVAALKTALYQSAEEIATDARRRVPVKSGALKNSIHVEPPKETGSKVEVTIGAGDAAATYAVYVHEDLTKNHPNGEAKFIERPLLEKMPKIPQRIIEEVKRRRR